MEARAYKTKAGTMQFRPVVSAEEFEDRNNGFCLACGAEAYGVEPDARHYKCESCGAEKVYGLEELLIMGLLIIGGDDY